VDDATVEIENINRNLAMGKETVQAILDGAQQIAVPALVSTLCICIVFIPMFFLSGVARFCSCRWPKRFPLRCWRRICGRALLFDAGMYLLSSEDEYHRKNTRRKAGFFPPLPAGLRAPL